jgi:hypothetical protein
VRRQVSAGLYAYPKGREDLRQSARLGFDPELETTGLAEGIGNLKGAFSEARVQVLKPREVVANDNEVQEPIMEQIERSQRLANRLLSDHQRETRRLACPGARRIQKHVDVERGWLSLLAAMSSVFHGQSCS